MPKQHPDPIAEGLTHSGQRLVQLIAIAAMGSQAYQRHLHQVQHARQTQQLEAHRKAELARRALFEQARSQWAPAHDPKWLQQANLVQVARAWSAALPYCAVHRPAGVAVDKCEERLRQLHPHGMEHYDRFRSKGLSHLEAMREAAPFFTRDPHVRTGEPAADRQPLPEGSGARWAADEHSPDLHEQQEHRQEQQALKIIGELQAQAPEDPTPEDLRIALEVATNLPGRIITRAVQQATQTAEGPTTGPEPSRPPKATPQREGSKPRPLDGSHPGPRTPTQVAGDDFAYGIREAIRLAAHNPAEQPSPGESPHPSQPRHHRPSR